MNPIQRFIEFAAAFEKTYVDDDWSRLESFLTEDAVYEVTGGPPLGGRFEGRDAVLAQRDKINAKSAELDAPPAPGAAHTDAGTADLLREIRDLAARIEANTRNR